MPLAMLLPFVVLGACVAQVRFHTGTSQLFTASWALWSVLAVAGALSAFALANRMRDFLPAELDHVFFTGSGSEAADTSLKMARAYWRAKGQGSKTRFIGRDGRVLDEVHGPQARYRPRPGDRYVRAQVEDSDGSIGWVQPVYPG